MPGTGEHIVLCTVKDEGPYLVEWIAYHQMIGFSRIVIASNDCSDGTRQMLDYLDAAGEISHVENSGQGPGEVADPQNRAYARFWADETIRRAEWLLVADADEFLNIKAGDGTLDALFTGVEARQGRPVDVISATWRVFGNGGVVDFADAPVVEQFTRAAPAGINRIQRYAAVKTLFRPRGVRKLGIHRPRFAPRFTEGKAPLVWVNGSGEEITGRIIAQGWRSFGDTYGCDLVQMNHYMIKSSEAFLMKRYRGTANSADAERIDFGYFETFNANDAEETSICRHVGALKARMAALFDAHPHLRLLHQRAVAHHRGRIADARAEVIRDLPEIAAKLGL